MTEWKPPHKHGKKTNAQELKKTLSKNAKFENVAQIFKILDDPKRIKIFYLLCHANECVSDIAAYTQLSASSVSHHLQVLRYADLVQTTRDGKEIFYRVSDSTVASLIHETIEKVLNVPCSDERENADTEEIVHRVHEYLTNNLDKKITIEYLAKKFPINATTLKKEFRHLYGDSIAAHIRSHRMEKAKELLESTQMNIAEVSRKTGYESQSRFTSIFRTEYGVTPLEFRKKISILS